MVWDLRGALLKKEERESARLAEFEFRLRVRTFKLLAQALEMEPNALTRLAARMDDNAAIAELSTRFPNLEVSKLFQDCRSKARAQLIAERGNPAPYRLL